MNQPYTHPDPVTPVLLCKHSFHDTNNGFQKCSECGAVRFSPSLRQQELQESVTLNSYLQK